MSPTLVRVRGRDPDAAWGTVEPVWAGLADLLGGGGYPRANCWCWDGAQRRSVSGVLTTEVIRTRTVRLTSGHGPLNPSPPGWVELRPSCVSGRRTPHRMHRLHTTELCPGGRPGGLSDTLTGPAENLAWLGSVGCRHDARLRGDARQEVGRFHQRLHVREHTSNVRHSNSDMATTLHCVTPLVNRGTFASYGVGVRQRSPTIGLAHVPSQGDDYSPCAYATTDCPG